MDGAFKLNLDEKPVIQILLVEDDPVLGRGLAVNLELEGYKVEWAKNLRSAYQINENLRLNLVLLDLGLPDGNGIAFLRKLRLAGSRLPIIILTAQSDEDSVVEGLNGGANDYVKKPFSGKELLARIKSTLRQPQQQTFQMRYMDLLILIDERRVLFDDKEIELNRREFDILRYLVQHAESVVTRDALLESLGKDGEIFDRTIDSHVSHIRSRITQAGISNLKISSVYGVGYRLETI